MQHEPADCPFQYPDADIASHAGGKYVIVVDVFSGWRHVGYLGHQASTTKVITALLDVVRLVGVAEGLWSDGGPEFSRHISSEISRKTGDSLTNRA